MKKYCKSVHFYKRDSGIQYIFKSLPYIVSTRTSGILLRTLIKEKYPILFEGLHTTFCLNISDLADRIKIVRTHNIEHEYYTNLSEVENNQISKRYFKMEARKLHKYEDILKNATHIAAISRNDHKYFSKKYEKVAYIPAFHPNNTVSIKEGFGDYILYHGNLSVGENISAALYLINEIFSRLNLPLIIAGKNPDKEILKAARPFKHIKVIPSPSKSEMDAIVSNAHINLLPTFQETGIKLKLLAALFSGRHCIVNHNMIKNTGMESLCSLKNKPQTIVKEIKRLYKIPFSKKLINEREKLLLKDFSNLQNAKKLITLIGY
ncbi:MAG: glycosyltransferase [Bacteroidia bacterium]|nr:glycosyltransferase [Bacteroidia bacterium]